MLVRSLAGLRCALQVPQQGLMLPGPGQNQLLRTGICARLGKFPNPWPQSAALPQLGGAEGDHPRAPTPQHHASPLTKTPALKAKVLRAPLQLPAAWLGVQEPRCWVQEQKAAAGGCRSRAPGADGCTCPLANSPVPKPAPLHPHLATGCRPREAVDLSTQHSKCHRRRKYFQIGSYSRQNQPSPCHVCSQVLHMGIHGSFFFFLPPKATSKASDLHHMFLTLLSNTVL